MSLLFWRRYAVVCVVLLLAGLLEASGAATYLFGPRVFTRAAGAPKIERVTFVAPVSGDYVLHAESHNVSAAVVTLNAATILTPTDFPGPPDRTFDKHVTLKASNQLTVELQSIPGSTLRISILGSAETDPPLITASASPAANAAGWNNGNVTVTFACSDSGSGIAVCPAPIVVTQEGANQKITGEAVDKAGNRASASVTLNIDRTAPQIGAHLSAPANAAGWHSAPVTVTFDCTDALSGAPSCPAPVTVSTSGAAQAISGAVVDRAGNRATAQATINLDLVPPTITATASTTGASNGAVTIHFTCSDGESGVETCPADVTVSNEGANQPITGVAIDKAGNTARATASVTIDRTKPTIVATAAPAPNGAGWHSASQVTVTFMCADTGSGIASCPAPVTVTAEGSAQPVSGTATDNAGNTATASLDINLDRTPPAIAAEPSATGWSSSNVVVHFTCSDTLSGIDTCADPITVTSEGTQSVTGAAVDKAGNTATASATVQIDRTAPQVNPVLTPAANAAGWARDAVTVSFQCSDSGSQIESCAQPVTVTEDTAGQVVTGRATDKAGNSATASVTVKIDRAAPQLTITSPIAGATVSEAVIAVTGTLTDALSGAATVTCGGSAAVVSGDAFICSTTLEAGANSVQIEGADAAGNVSRTTLSLTLNTNGTPIAQAGGPYSGETGKSIKFDGSGSSDPDGQTLTYKWTFGDGGTATGVAPTHTFASAGSFSIELTVTDTKGASSSSSSAATIATANRPPTANAGGPYTGDAAQTITFTASQSSDPDGDPLTYSWTFGDGSSALGSVVKRSYSTPGSYTAKLTVDDGRGGTATATASVTVRAINQRPTAQIGGPYRGEAGQAIVFAGSGSDPDNDSLSYTWSFGDGSSASGAAASHVFAAAGTFVASLTVSDGRGGSSAASTQVFVTAANRAPAARISAPGTASAGASVALSADGSTDPDNDPLTFSWNFGDGRSATGASPSHAYSAPGTFTITLVATDTHGASSTATAAIAIDRATENRTPVANAGGPYNGEVNLALAFSGSGSSDPDGDALTYAWNFGDGSSGSGVTPSHAFTEARDYTVTLTVSDSHGASHSSTAVVHVAAQVDRTPPVVTLNGPQSVLPGTKARVQAQAADNVGVASIAFEVSGAPAGTLTAPPFAIDVDVPAVGAPGAKIPVKATARDAAGNAASSQIALTITAQPDNEDPTVALQVPAAAAPGSSIRVGATASDNDGVAKVVFTVAGVVVATDTEAPFETSYAIPSGAAIGSAVQVFAEAFDHTGNRASASASIGIAETVDTTPPAIQLTAPPMVVAGGTLSLSAIATDQSGVAAVIFTVDGARIATVTSAPYQASYAVPLTAAAGMQLHVEARAVDVAGLDAADAKQTVVTSPIENGDAFVIGEVYDDATGLPMPGASVSITGQTSRPAITMVTDDRGRYASAVDPGDLSVVISRDGYTTVERVSPAAAGVRELIDARLTPRASGGQEIAPVLGGTLTGDNASVIVPAGAVAAPTTFNLTVVGQQGLRGVLPAGWSPLAVVDVAPHGSALAVPATLRVQLPAGSASGALLTLAAWDAQSRAWRAIATATPASGLLEAPIDRTGQFAWMQPDQIPAAPAQPAVGELVAGVAAIDVPDGATTAITPQPKVLFYQPGVHSSVRGVLTASSPVPSGTRLWTRVSESYRFFSGAEIYPDPTVQDVFFYQANPAAQTLAGTFVASPSRTFEALTLDQGVIGLELYVPPVADAPAIVIPPSGGSVSLATGERLEFAQGAAASSVAAALRRLTKEELGAPLPNELTFLGAIDVTLSGAAVTKPGVLSMAKPADLAADAQVLLVRLATLQDRTRFVLAAVGRIEGDRVVAEPKLPLNGLEMEGVRASGRYLFVKPSQAVGFVAGHVLGVNGECVAGAMVSSETLPIVALSRAATGEYVIAARVGAVALAALDLQKADRGTGSVTLTAAREEAALDLRLVAEPPRVTSVTPASGATSVALSTAIVAIFSEPIDPATVSGANAGNVLLAGPSGAPIAGTTGLSGGNTLLTFRPAAALEPDTLHTFTLAASIADATGQAMGAPFTLTFATLDTTPPPPPPAGSLSASIPENGSTTVRGTQGTAGVHDTVTIENITRGTSTAVLLDPNGGFLAQIQASAGDVLKLKIVDQAGNETLVDIPGFTRQNADGSISGVVGAAGGHIDGPNGTAVDVPAGSLPDGSIVTVKSVDAQGIPVAMSAEQKTAFPFAGGIQVDFNGATPAKYVNVSVPSAAGDKTSDQWIVAQVMNVGGQPVFNAVDTAKLIDGRVRTSSPPCPGVLAAGVYGIYKSTQPIGLAWGRMYASGSYDGLRLSVGFAPLTIGVPLAFPVYAWENPQPMCLPVLSGRVTVGLNATRFRLRRDALHADDREIIIRNVTGGGGESHFRRNVLEYAFEVPGSASNSFAAFVVSTSGQQRQADSVDVKPGPSGKVIVSLDPDTIDVTVASVIIRNLSATPAQDTTFAVSDLQYELAAGGGVSDFYWVTVIDANGVSRALDTTLYTKLPSMYGPGNLVARALPGTIDPTKAEIIAANPGGPMPTKWRDRVELHVFDPNTNHELPNLMQVIPDDKIIVGGFNFAFEGEESRQYAVDVVYNTGERESIVVPRLRLVVQNALTGEVVKTIAVQAPPRDEPLGIGAVTNDGAAPLLTGSPIRLDSFDPSMPLTFTFSEAMDADTIRQSAIVERVTANGRERVAGAWRVYANNRTATFVPDAPLRIGEEYSVTFVGNDALGGVLSPNTLPVTDLGGNAIATTRLRIKTFTPRLVRSVFQRPNRAPLDEINDIAIRRVEENHVSKTYLFAATNAWTDGPKFVVYDATNADKTTEVGFANGSFNQRQLTLVPDLGRNGNAPLMFRQAQPRGACGGEGPAYSGDLAVSVGYNVDYSFLQAWYPGVPVLDAEGNVTFTPCLLTTKLLTANPDTLNSFTTHGTTHAVGFAEGIATIRHSQGIAAFTAVREVGLFATDLGKEIPERVPADRQQDPFVSGDFYDVVAFQDRLLAANNAGRSLDIYDPNLAPIGSVALTGGARHIAIAENYGVDEDGDGFIRPDEVRNLAFVATRDCPSPAPCRYTIEIVDLKTLSNPEVIGSITMPGFISGIDIDPAKRRLFATGSTSATTQGNDAFFIIDISRPTAISTDADHDGFDDRIIWKKAFAGGLNRPAIDKERGLAYLPVADGNVLRKGRLEIWAIYDNCCDLAVNFTAAPSAKQGGNREGLLRKEREALREGIRQGLQKAAQSCNLSVPTITILEQGSGACLWRGHCDDNYQPGLSDHDFEVFVPDAAWDRQTPDGRNVATCTTAELNAVFVDPATNEPKDVVLPNGDKMAFEDITFFPEVRERFESATFDVEVPSSSGSDAVGDMGLGRRSLLLKWLLEGAYVTEVPGYSVEGRSLDAILSDLKNITKIPRLEGFEWSVLQDFALAKSKAYLRIAGASKAESAFHKLFVKQLHDAGKAGIRATMARLVAHPDGNTLVLDVTRQKFDSNACYEISVTVTNPATWPEKPCSSFEEYVASAAARSLRDHLGVFTLDEVVNQAYRFFKVKSDRERIASEPAADAFIAMASRFIANARAATRSIYDTQLPGDRDVTLRVKNMTTAGNALNKALKEATLPLTPHVFSRGFRNGTDLRVAMYHTTANGSGQLEKEMRVDLAGGEDRYLDFLRDANGGLALANGKAQPIFQLKADLTVNIGQPRGVSFIIDLPDRSMKESNRQNNVGGFFYYVLDRNTGATPQTPSAPYFPLSDNSLLDPSPECYESPMLMTTQVIRAGDEVLGDEAILGRGEVITIAITVQNMSTQAVDDVVVCSNITHQCYNLGTLAPGETRTQTIDFVSPDEDAYIDGTASAYSPVSGVITGADARLIVNGNAYAIQPLMDETEVRAVDPDLLSLQLGGTAVRHYRIVGRRSGQPKPNMAVTAELNGLFGSTTGTKTMTFSTNQKGEICTPANGGACSTELASDDRGLQVPFQQGMQSSTSYAVRLTQVNGLPIGPENFTEFSFDLKDRDWSQSYAAGSSVEGTLLTTSVSVEDGFELSKSGKYLKGVEELGLSLSKQVGVTGKVEFSLLPGLKTKIGVGELKLEAKAGTTESKTPAADGEEYKFTYVPNADTRPGQPPMILDQDSQCAITALTVQHFVDRSPLTNKLLDLVREHPCNTNLDKYLVGRSKETSWSSTDSVSAGLSFKSLLRAGAESKLNVKIGADGGASAGFTTKHESAFAFENGVATLKGEKHGYSMFGKVNFTLGLSANLAPADENKDDDAVEVKTFEKALKSNFTSTTLDSYGVTFDYEAGKTKPRSVKIKYAGPKGFGWKGNVGGDGAGAVNLNAGLDKSISYTLSREEDIARAVEALANIKAIENTISQQQLAILELGLTPTLLNQEYGRFRSLLFKSITPYTETESRGTGVEAPFGLEGKWLGLGVGLSLTAKVDAKTAYPVTVGVNYKGRTLPLQKYRKDDYLPPYDLSLADFIGQLWSAASESFDPQFSHVGAPITPAGPPQTLKSTMTATMTINPAQETEAFDAALYSYHYRSIAGPVHDGVMSPADAAGPAGLPHYGIGGFHHFSPNDRPLATPTPLVIDYKDPEVESFDESTFAIYGWNVDTRDWEYVGGVVDRSNNTVTATVNKLRAYTVAPRMPAGAIQIHAVDNGVSGTDQSATRRFTVTTDPLRNNDGTPVADGTLYTVRSLVNASNVTADYGTLLVTDADAGRENVQVAVVNGRLQFQVEYASPAGFYLPGRVAIYSTAGTAFGAKVMAAGGQQ